jgi:DNA transposition AAA+ family ATPase
VGRLHHRRPHLEALGLPGDAEMIRRTRAFTLLAGLTLNELADLASINPSTLRVYLSGSYNVRVPGTESNSLGIRAALKQMMDLHEIHQQPMLAERHYETADYAAIRESMWSAFREGTAFLVDGPPGTQKTYTFRRVADEINRSGEGRAIYIYARIDHSPQSFLIEICTEAGIPNRGSIDQLIRKLRFFLAGRRALLIVDEAQHLGMTGLEVLRQLLDTPPYFGVGIGGSHDLSLRLGSWQMEQWRSRLRRTHQLKGLAAGEASAILQAELGRLDAQDVADSIADATVSAVRDKLTFKYVSARNLFFAIQDARKALNAVPTILEPEEVVA